MKFGDLNGEKSAKLNYANINIDRTAIARAYSFFCLIAEQHLRDDYHKRNMSLFSQFLT